MYNEFEGWRKINNISSRSERMLLVYFAILSESYLPTTIWAYYSMLKSILKVNNRLDIPTYTELTCFFR